MFKEVFLTFFGLRKYAAHLSLLLNYQGKTADISIQGGKKTTVSNTIFSLKSESFDINVVKDFLQKDFPLQQGVLNAGLSIEVLGDDKTINVNGTVGVKNARLNDEDKNEQSVLPEFFQIEQRLILNTENFATKINKALITVPEAGEVLLKGNLLPGETNKNVFSLNLTTKDFNVANYLRAIGHKVPTKSRVLVTSSFDFGGSDAKKSIDLKGTVSLRGNKDYEFSAATEAQYYKKNRYSNITFRKITGKENGEEKPFLLVNEVRFKKTKISAKKTQVGSLYVTAPEFQLVQNKRKQLNFVEAIDSFLLQKKNNHKKNYPLYVNYLKVKKGKASYIDKSSKKVFSHFQLADISLTASGIAPHSKAKLKVDAKVMNPSRNAYLFVDGKVNPFTLESKNLKLRVKRLPLKDFSYIAKNLNDITIQNGDLDVFVQIDVDKKTNYVSRVDFELYKLKVKFPQKDEAKSAFFVETLKRDGDVIKLKNIKLTGNIKQEEYDFSGIKTAIIKQSLTSAPVLATSAGVVGGTALFSNVLATVLMAASPIVLPVTAAVLGGTAIYKLMNEEDKTKLALKK